MIPTEFGILFVGEKGNHERDIRRDDNLISHRYTRLMILSHPKLGKTYIEAIIWDRDKRVDVKVANQNINPSLEPLKKIKFHSKKFKSDPYLNVFRLQYLNNNGKKYDHTLQSLEKITNRNVAEYFKTKNIKLFRQKQLDNNIALFAQHQYYSDTEILEIYLVSVFIAFCLANNILNVVNLKTNSSNSNESYLLGSFESFKQKAITFIFATFLFVGCFSIATRKRIGATCNDGSKSHSIGSGTCSHHGGVKTWTYEYWWDN